MIKYDYNLPLVGGGFFISREEFELRMKEPRSPKDYTYDEYVLDSTESEDEYKTRMNGAS